MPLTLFLEGGKRPWRRQVVAPPSPPSSSSELQPPPLTPAPAGSGLLYLEDQLSRRRFLVDTGAAVSVFPFTSSNSPSSRRLTAADGNRIPSWGTRLLPLKFGARRFEWSFLLAQVDRPILGADFLRANGLIVDLQGSQLLDSSTMSPLPASTSSPASSTSQLYTALLSTPDVVRDLLAEFPDIVGSGFSDLKPTHGVQHHISTRGQPVFAKARRLDPDKLAIARAEFQKMEDAGIIRRSNSPWASPLHMVPKGDGSWRPCGDYRALNNVTVPDRYPVPNIHDFSNRLDGCRYFTKLDLVKGYYQVPMAKGDIAKTAVITPFGLFEWLAMPFGLRNAGNTFQRMMDRLGVNLPFVFIYLDDVLIASPDLPTHVRHLRLVLERLRSFGLVMNPAKCLFAQAEVPFLGHVVSVAGVAPLPGHLQTIKDFPPPVDKPALQRFLGLLNFFRRFLPSAAAFLRPLTDALKASSDPFTWSSSMQASFDQAKSALLSASSLKHPVPGAEVSLAVDASGSHVGGVLQQRVGGHWAPMGFFSRKLSSAESNYSTFDRELLAAYSSLRHFRFMLEGRSFTLFTDHRPLTSALFRVSPPWSARQQRHLAFVAEFTSDIQYLPGPENQVADALSRPSSPPPPPPPPGDGPVLSAVLLGPDLLEAQLHCTDCQGLSKEQKFDVRPSGGEGVLASFSSGSARVLLPVQFRRDAFDSVHGLAHPSVRATRRLLSSRFLWPAMNADISTWAKDCLPCQAAKVLRHQRTPLQSIPVPARRFSHIHMDLVGPLKSSKGFTSLLTIIDRSSRWPEVIPMSSTTSTECFDAFLRHWVSRFGVPATLTTDRGPQFTSTVWASLCKSLGIHHVMTTAFHPQANGMIERVHRRLKDALRARCASTDWYDQLPLVLLGLRVSPKEDSNVSTAEMVYGTTLALPGTFLDEPEPPGEVFQRQLRRAFDRWEPPEPFRSVKPLGYVDRRLHQVSHVFVRRDGHVPPLEPLYSGPYLVLRRQEKSFVLQIGDRSDSVSVDRLKPVISSVAVEAQVPPRRGRPPKQRPDHPAAARRPRGRPRRFQPSASVEVKSGGEV